MFNGSLMHCILQDLDPDPTATQPTIVDAVLSAINLATIHETQGASLPQPTSEYVPDNTDVPPTVIQVPADEAEDVSCVFTKAEQVLIIFYAGSSGEQHLATADSIFYPC